MINRGCSFCRYVALYDVTAPQKGNKNPALHGKLARNILYDGTKTKRLEVVTFEFI